MDRRKIVFCVHRFYPEVASTAQLMTELAFALSDEFDIEVVAIRPTDDVSRSSSDAVPDNVKIHYLRVPKMDKRNRVSRILHIVFYFLFALARVLTIRHKALLYVISQPPIIGGAIGLVAHWLSGCPYLYNVQDFNPEQTEAVGYIRRTAVLEIARKLDSLACTQSKTLVVVGRDMVGTVQRRGILDRVRNVEVINNWTDETELFPLPRDDERIKAFRQRHGIDYGTVFMYSGNLGLYYDLVRLTEVIVTTEWIDGIHFAFIGDGAVKPDMERIVRNASAKHVTFIPYQDKKDLNVALNAGDVHLVVNQNGIKGVSVPSKLYGVMAVGKPVLALQEDGSEGSLIIEESGCGVWGRPGDHKWFISMVNRMASSDYRPQLEQMATRGRSYLLDNLTKNKSIQRYKRVIHSICVGA